jgi:predicted esterase
LHFFNREEHIKPRVGEAVWSWVGAGDRDPIVPRTQPEELSGKFESGRANVTLLRDRGGRELGADDIEAAKKWSSGVNARKKVEA